MQEAAVKNLGEKALLLRILGAGLILILLLWSVLAPPARAQAIPASDLLLRADTPELTFRWAAPPEATLEPALFRALRMEAEQNLAAETRSAAADAAQARKAKFPFRAHSWSQRWQPEAETPQLLALSARLSSYTGGAHGNAGFATTLFDRSAQTRIAFADLFSDSKAALAALTPGWCAALDAERARRRAGEANAMFSDCPPLADLRITPVGDGRIHSLRVMADPYVAGPWVEGSYEILLDPAPALGFLKPAYRPAFAKP